MKVLVMFLGLSIVSIVAAEKHKKHGTETAETAKTAEKHTPLIRCETAKGCKTQCDTMPNPKECSHLTVCEMGPDKEGQGFCNDQKACATDDDCPRFEHHYETGHMKMRYVQTKCKEQKCRYDGTKGIQQRKAEQEILEIPPDELSEDGLTMTG